MSCFNPTFMFLYDLLQINPISYTMPWCCPNSEPWLSQFPGIKYPFLSSNHKSSLFVKSWFKCFSL
jgi:hypothetical protein